MKYILTILLTLILSVGYGQNQMKMWQYDTFKQAEKARKWRSKQKVGFLWTRSTRPKRNTRKKFTYGQPTTIRHKGLR